MVNYIGVIANIPPRPFKAALYREDVFNEPEFIKVVEGNTIGNIVPINTEPNLIHKYKVTGTVTQNELPVERTLRLYRESNGELMSETISAANGTYTLTTPYNEDHYVVCLDAIGGENFNHLIRKNVDIVSL
jgi:hypothetical protein